MDLTPQRRAFSRVLNRLARNTKIVFSPQRGGFSWALCLYDFFTDSICLRDGRSTWEPSAAIFPCMAPTRTNHKLNPCDPIVNVEGVLMLLQLRSEFQFEDVTWGKTSFWWLSVQRVKLQHLSFRPTLKMGRGDLNIRQILILDLQLQVWSLEPQTSTIPLCRRHSWECWCRDSLQEL